MTKQADRVGSLDDFSNEDKKGYLEGVLDRIEVRLDKETNDHGLESVFQIGLFGNGIESIDPGEKGAGYELIKGATEASIITSHAVTQNRHKDARKVERQEQNAKRGNYTLDSSTA